MIWLRLKIKSRPNTLKQKRLRPYQTSVAVIKAKLSGYVPVCMVLNGGHVRELDRTAEMVKLQLKAGGFLYDQVKRLLRRLL